MEQGNFSQKLDPEPKVFGIRSSRVLGRKSLASKRFQRWISRRPGPFAPDEAFRQSISGFRHPRAAERRPHVRSWFPRNWSSDISTTDGAGESFFPKPLTGQGAFFFWSETPRPPLFGGKAENGDPLYIKGKQRRLTLILRISEKSTFQCERASKWRILGISSFGFI